MRQLSGLDYAFLQFERGNTYMHVAGLGLYDPSTAPGGKVRFKDILRFFSARIERFPHFRRRLVTVPWMLDRPWWVEEAEIDVEFHVRHIALPQPGDWRQLCIQVARLHSRPLDRSKPLWEAYVIEGLHNVPGVPPGSFALYTKVHHALIDGEAGSELTQALHSISPDDVEADEGPGLTVRVADREPSAVEIYSRALAGNLQKLARRDIAQHGARWRQSRERSDGPARYDFAAERPQDRRQRIGDPLRAAARDRPSHRVGRHDQPERKARCRRILERDHAVRRGARQHRVRPRVAKAAVREP